MLENTTHDHIISLHSAIADHSSEVAQDLLKLTPYIPRDLAPKEKFGADEFHDALNRGCIPAVLFENGYPTLPFKRQYIIDRNGDLKLRLHIDTSLIGHVDKKTLKQYIEKNKKTVDALKQNLKGTSEARAQLLARFSQPNIFEDTKHKIIENKGNSLVLEVSAHDLLDTVEEEQEARRASPTAKALFERGVTQNPDMTRLANFLFPGKKSTTKALVLIKRLRIAHDNNDEKKKRELEEEFLPHYMKEDIPGAEIIYE